MIPVSRASHLCGILALLACGLVSAMPTASDTPTDAAGLPANPTEFPQRRVVNGTTLVLHAPQIRSWPGFERLEAVLAVEVTPPDGKVRYGTAKVSGATEVDLDKRVVKVTAPRFDSVRFTESVPEGLGDAVMKRATRSSLAVPLDLFLAHLADDVLVEPPPRGFNVNPPPILVRSTPTLLLHINGEPVYESVRATKLQRVVNANWPLFRSTESPRTYYLLERDRWQSSNDLARGWKAVTSLPEAFARLPDEPPYRAAREAYPAKAHTGRVTTVIHVTTPTELIVTDGAPIAEAIPGAKGMEYVSNTTSPLFRVAGDWYYLVAGRWFKSANLEKGPWIWAPQLPEVFSLIPKDHAMAAVRASIPGTVEARLAALESLLPTKVSATLGAAPPVKVAYAAEPKFEPIPGTKVARAANTGFDVIRYGQRYYLLYSGIWYVAATPLGPWAAVASVPSAIYEIPPSSPSYHVTHVTATTSTTGHVVYSYPPAYTSGIYVVYGVTYYGTGWHYPPYIYGAYYYPYAASYGYGSVYNPNTGSYGSRSVWAGPYGGYSHNQAYNPNTGSYGYVSTAWNGDEWASYGQTHNARTGISTETSRYYNENQDRSELERTVQRGDQSVTTNRTVDYDNRQSQTSRETSQGGSSSRTREVSDGVLSTSGDVTTGDGGQYAISREATRTGGSTSIIGEDRSAAIETQRQDGRSVATVEGTDGGRAASVSTQGAGRTSVGQTSSGDLYAGRNGNVYKRSDDSWQTYQNGEWQKVDVPASSKADPASRSRSSGFGARAETSDFSQLDRDFSARQNAGSQSRQRSNGGLRGGGGGRRR